MSQQQDLQQRLIQQQQLKKLLQYQKQQLLQNTQFNSPPNKPILEPSIYTQGFLLSHPKKQSNKKYIHAQIDSKIAQRQTLTILNTWNNQSEYFPDEIYLRKIQRQSRRNSFQKQLTISGKENIEEIISIARSNNNKTPLIKPIRQKYERSYKKKQLDDDLEPFL